MIKEFVESKVVSSFNLIHASAAVVDLGGDCGIGPEPWRHTWSRPPWLSGRCRTWNTIPTRLVKVGNTQLIEENAAKGQFWSTDLIYPRRRIRQPHVHSYAPSRSRLVWWRHKHVVWRQWSADGDRCEKSRQRIVRYYLANCDDKSDVYRWRLSPRPFEHSYPVASVPKRGCRSPLPSNQDISILVSGHCYSHSGYKMKYIISNFSSIITFSLFLIT